MDAIVTTTTKFVSPKFNTMRKNTKARFFQHIPAKPAIEGFPATSYKKTVPNEKNKSGYSTVTVKVPAVPATPATRGKAIKHSR